MDSGERAALHDELSALARGDRAAFDPLFRRLWPLVRGFAARCLPREEAEDAAQEALLRVFARASEFDAARDALSWVLGVAAWQIRTHRTRARRSREEASGALPEREDESPSPESVALSHERPEELDRALGCLPAGATGFVGLARCRGGRSAGPRRAPSPRLTVTRGAARAYTRQEAFTMNVLLAAMTALVLASATAPSKATESPLACDRDSLTTTERKRHFDVLGPKLVSLKKSVKELPDGYEIELPPDPATVKLAMEWAAGERLSARSSTSLSAWSARTVPSGCG